MISNQQQGQIHWQQENLQQKSTVKVITLNDVNKLVSPSLFKDEKRQPCANSAIATLLVYNQISVEEQDLIKVANGNLRSWGGVAKLLAPYVKTEKVTDEVRGYAPQASGMELLNRIHELGYDKCGVLISFNKHYVFIAWQQTSYYISDVSQHLYRLRPINPKLDWVNEPYEEIYKITPHNLVAELEPLQNNYKEAARGKFESFKEAKHYRLLGLMSTLKNNCTVLENQFLVHLVLRSSEVLNSSEKIKFVQFLIAKLEFRQQPYIQHFMVSPELATTLEALLKDDNETLKELLQQAADYLNGNLQNHPILNQFYNALPSKKPLLIQQQATQEPDYHQVKDITKLSQADLVQELRGYNNKLSKEAKDNCQGIQTLGKLIYSESRNLEFQLRVEDIFSSNLEFTKLAMYLINKEW